MRCTTCGTENAPDADYCVNCGVPVGAQPSGEGEVTYCTNYGTGNSQGSKFCFSCGATLQARPRGMGSPEAAPTRVDVEYMGFWIRLAAEVIDYIVLGVAIIVFFALTGVTPLLGVLFLPVIVYGFYKHFKCQTLGRKLLGISVVNGAGEPISFWRGLLREVFGKAISQMFLYLGYIWVAFDGHKQGWHDKIAGTYVIRKVR